MAAGLSCRVCSGELRLLLSGAGAPVGADAFSPSCHELGLHGDLLICHECGSVEQPALPSGEELHALYRETRDGSYLTEEAGRRATARRLLELVAEHVPAGRLLDVGCGPGLLLDEARTARIRRRRRRALARGGAATPATRSASTCTRSRSRTSTTTPASTSSSSRTSSSTSTTRSAPSRAALTCCVPAGSCASSRPTRRRPPRGSPGGAGGATCPRTPACSRARTLRELLVGAGLVVAADVPLVRTFAARRWVGGLAERLGRLQGPVDAVARHVPAQASLSLSLGDERVILAQQVAVTDARRPADVRPRRREVGPRRPARLPRRPDDPGGHRRDACRRRRPRAARRRREPGRHELRRARARPGRAAPPGQPRLRRKPEERLPARAPRRRGRHRHGPRRRPVRPRARRRSWRSRSSTATPTWSSARACSTTSAIAGGMPRWKWVGNRLLTGIENRAFGVRFSEYHTGYRAFSATCCGRSRSCATPTTSSSTRRCSPRSSRAARGSRRSRSRRGTSTRRRASSFATSVRYGLETLGVLARFTAHRHGRSWTLLRRPAVDWPEPAARSARPAA